MTDLPDSLSSEALKVFLVRKRDELIRRAEILDRERMENLAQRRANDRAMADVKASARLFNLAIEFPADEREEYERTVAERRLREAAVAARHIPEPGRVVVPRAFAGGGPVVSTSPQLPLPAPVVSALPDKPAPPSAAAASPAAKPSRPPLREVVLEMLKQAGEKGGRASAFRDLIERTYGEALHEKTVGMTLYRLSQKNKARRDGHNWFYVEPSGETENPGGETPGLTKSE